MNHDFQSCSIPGSEDIFQGYSSDKICFYSNSCLFGQLQWTITATANYTDNNPYFL